MNGLMHRSKLCLFDQLIGADLLRRLSSIFWIEIGSYVDSLRSCACPISPDFTTTDLIEIKLDQECRCRSGRSARKNLGSGSI